MPIYMEGNMFFDSQRVSHLSDRIAYQSPRLSLLGAVCDLTEAGSSGSMELGNCSDGTGSMARVMC